ncbi:MAG TPA: lysophospholipid acyltransferase family protein [Nitrospirota bacterium]|nr:lysophospholipid acyltransferase family protein [Nitrospirota bacterium]
MNELLFKNGSYKTAPGPVSFFSRACPSFAFYADVFSIVYRGSAKAKRGHYPTAAWAYSSLETFRALERVGVHIEITGVDHFQTLEGPCVFIGNHMSTLETFVLPAIIAPFKDVTFVIKRSLIDYPVFKHIMRSRDPIVVDRTNPRKDFEAVLEGGTARLKAGRSVIIFPQTTRTATVDPETFNTIGIKLARKAGVPIVPIALRTEAWGNGRLLKDFGRIDPSKPVHIAFGKPLLIKGRGAEEHGEIIEFILKKLKEWK